MINRLLPIFIFTAFVMGQEVEVVVIPGVDVRPGLIRVLKDLDRRERKKTSQTRDPAGPVCGTAEFFCYLVQALHERTPPPGKSLSKI